MNKYEPMRALGTLLLNSAKPKQVLENYLHHVLKNARPFSWDVENPDNVPSIKHPDATKGG